MQKRFVIANLSGAMYAITQPKLQITLCSIDAYYPNKGKMFYDTFEEAERMLLEHYNGVNILLMILPVYTNAFEVFKDKFKVH